MKGHLGSLEIPRRDPRDAPVKFMTTAAAARIIADAASIKGQTRAEFLRATVEPVARNIIAEWRRQTS